MSDLQKIFREKHKYRIKNSYTNLRFIGSAFMVCMERIVFSLW